MGWNGSLGDSLGDSFKKAKDKNESGDYDMNAEDMREKRKALADRLASLSTGFKKMSASDD